jgi:hypothetical protein
MTFDWQLSSARAAAGIRVWFMPTQEAKDAVSGHYPQAKTGGLRTPMLDNSTFTWTYAPVNVLLMKVG